MKSVVSSITALLCLLLLSKISLSQVPNVVISADFGPNEPSISMDPKNPDHLVAGANINSYYFSTDGGQQWTRGTLLSPENGVWGDPCIIVDTAGAFYFLHLSNPPAGNWIDRIVSQKFDILTNSWSNDSYMGLNDTLAQDKEWAVVDSTTNNIYVTWTQFDKYGSPNPDYHSNILFSRSVDGGASWSEALRINQVSGDCLDDDNTTEGAVPAVGPDGQIYVAWSGPEGIVFDKSLDGGDTWLDEDIFISDQPGGWAYDVPGIYRCNGLPVTVCDISNQSPHKGNIYVNWTDQRNGLSNPDVWLSRSTDGGDTWSAPVRVNDDISERAQFFSWMTVDQANGDIYLVFYDRRNYDDTNTDVYLARSTDGGLTFENILISESPFVPYSSVFFGDYTNIVAHDGRVRPIWGRLDNGNQSVLTALIDGTVDIKPAMQPELLPMVLEHNYPNPFVESTFISFKLHKESVINLSVYDVYGRRITTLISDQAYEAGKYTFSFESNEHNMNPGVYYFILTSGKLRQQQKMMLIE